MLSTQDRLRIHRRRAAINLTLSRWPKDGDLPQHDLELNDHGQLIFVDKRLHRSLAARLYADNLRSKTVIGLKTARQLGMKVEVWDV